MSSYLTTSSAASTYQTISGMSSYLTTSAASSTYLTQSNAASTYQTQAGMTNYLSKAGNLSGLASTSTARTNLGLGTLSTFNDAPADGSQYARKNNAWEVVSGGGGGSETDFGFHFADFVYTQILPIDITYTSDFGDPPVYTWSFNCNVLSSIPFEAFAVSSSYQTYNGQYTSIAAYIDMHDANDGAVITTFNLADIIAGGVNNIISYGPSLAGGVYAVVRVEISKPSGNITQLSRLHIYSGTIY
jgi:hypothetical protein